MWSFFPAQSWDLSRKDARALGSGGVSLDFRFLSQLKVPEALRESTSGSLPELCVLSWRRDGGLQTPREAWRANLGTVHESRFFPTANLPSGQGDHSRSGVRSLVSLAGLAKMLSHSLPDSCIGSDQPIKVPLLFPRLARCHGDAEGASTRPEELVRFSGASVPSVQAAAERLGRGSPTIVQVGGHPWTFLPVPPHPRQTGRGDLGARASLTLR